MLDRPHRVEAEFIGERDLLEAIVEDALSASRSHGRGTEIS